MRLMTTFGMTPQLRDTIKDFENRDNTLSREVKNSDADRLDAVKRGWETRRRNGKARPTAETITKLKKARKGRTPNKPKEMVGKTFNRWTVLERADKNGSGVYWHCKCKCGERSIVSGYNLRNGISKSCGCKQKEDLAKRNRINLWSKGRKGVFSGIKRPEHSRRMMKENNSNWRGGISSENSEARRKLKDWRCAVFCRDKYTCKKCAIIGGALHAHHIENFAEHKNKRNDIENGVTLCKDCHRGFHSKYGIYGNNSSQLNEYLCQN
jgi:5-methylcytosine-specific restriction endonuclease McrA